MTRGLQKKIKNRIVEQTFPQIKIEIIFLFLKSLIALKQINGSGADKSEQIYDELYIIVCPKNKKEQGYGNKETNSKFLNIRFYQRENIFKKIGEI